MTKTDYKYYGKDVSYEILDNGYNIYLDGALYITQPEPYIPYPTLGYEGSCLKQIEELVNEEGQNVGQSKPIEELQQQITDIQVALCEVYEGLGV